MIEAKFSWIDNSHIHQRFPEKAIALGAAFFAETPRIVDNTPVPYAYAIRTFSSSLNRMVLNVIVPKDAKLPYTYKGEYTPLYDNQEGVDFVIYEVYSSEVKKIFEVDEGVETEYRFTHRFGKKVPKSTIIEVCTTLTKDGVLESTTNDSGVSSYGIQKNKIGLEHKK